MEFSRQGYWSGSPFPSPEDLPNPGTEPRSPAFQADSLPSKPPEKHNNVEHLILMYLLTMYISSLKKCFYSYFASFSFRLFAFLMLSCINCLCILGITPYQSYHLQVNMLSFRQWLPSLCKTFFFFFLLYFTILYWFCHTSTWILHRCTWVPNPEPPSHVPPHTISLGHPSAPAPSILYPALNLDWWFISYLILYMFQCHSPKSSHPVPLPLSPKVRYTHLCLFSCLAYRVVIAIFLNSIYMC